MRDRGYEYRNRDDYRRGRSPPGRRDRRTPPLRDEPQERPRLKLQPRSKPQEDAASDMPAASSSIFGGAKPVDTARREKEIEEKLKIKDQVEKKEGRKNSSGSVFGDAKPVDTARREKEIEEKLREKEGESDPKSPKSPLDDSFERKERFRERERGRRRDGDRDRDRAPKKIITRVDDRSKRSDDRLKRDEDWPKHDDDTGHKGRGQKGMYFCFT